jgi:phytoene/squalene synthetase
MGERGRIYIPVSELSGAGLEEGDLRRFVQSGVADSRWRCLVGSILKIARRFEGEGVAMAKARFPAMEPDCRFILALIIGMYQNLLAAIETDPACVLAGPTSASAKERLALIRRVAEETSYSPPGIEVLVPGRGGGPPLPAR